tara:strand:- start:378 stop:632 length:255 start_codon:yes stop_codon:yes gene_type:complete
MDSALLPFDSLGLAVSPIWRKEIAVQHAAHLSSFSKQFQPPAFPTTSNKFKLGYLCYDFNDHPTAHLAEGLFLYHNRSQQIQFR